MFSTSVPRRHAEAIKHVFLMHVYDYATTSNAASSTTALGIPMTDAPKSEGVAPEPRDQIDIFLDGAPKPILNTTPPLSFELDTSHLEDGPHVMRIEAYDAHGRAFARSTSLCGTAQGLRSRVSIRTTSSTEEFWSSSMPTAEHRP